MHKRITDSYSMVFSFPEVAALAAFCLVVEEGSISGVARELYISQPGVSKRIKGLEERWAVKLLERRGRGVTPTAEGRELYTYAKKLLGDAEALERAMRDSRRVREGRVRLAVSSTIGEHLVPEWIKGFREWEPKVVFELVVGNTREVISRVLEGDVPMGMVEGSPGEELISEPFLEDEMVVVVGPGHPWAGRRKVGWDELVKEAYVCREPGSGTRAVAEARLAELGWEVPVPTLELGSTGAIKRALEEGLGYSILSRSAISTEERSGELIVVPGLVLKRVLHMIRRPGSELSPLEKRFLNYAVTGEYSAS